MIYRYRLPRLVHGGVGQVEPEAGMARRWVRFDMPGESGCVSPRSRSNTRLLDRRIADLEAPLLDRPAHS